MQSRMRVSTFNIEVRDLSFQCSSSPRLNRQAFTLIELLVSLFVVAILVALLLPAISASREVSRSIACKNNLKQIVIASHNYADAFGRFGGTVQDFYYGLAPYLEVQLNESRYEPKRNAPTSFRCPSDEFSVQSDRNSYLVNGGRGRVAWENSVADGVFGADGRNDYGMVSPRDVADGMSSTAFMSERLIRLKTLDDYDPSAVNIAGKPDDLLADRWQFSVGEVTSSNPRLELERACENGPYTIPDSFVGPGAVAFAEQWGHVYNHVAGPNSLSCTNGLESDSTRVHYRLLSIPANSRHPGRVNIALCDGQVRTAHSGMDLDVWHAIASRHGREAVSLSF